jgi:hypothetical protein
MSGYSGAEWLEKGIGVNNISPLGREVADLLGDLFLGIYHMNRTSLLRVKWSDPRYIAVTIDGEIATFDADALTVFVVLCHDRCLRGAVEAVAPKHLRLSFSKRARGGSMWARHPTLEEHVGQIRAAFSVESGKEPNEQAENSMGLAGTE